MDGLLQSFTDGAGSFYFSCSGLMSRQTIQRKQGSQESPPRATTGDAGTVWGEGSNEKGPEGAVLEDRKLKQEWNHCTALKGKAFLLCILYANRKKDEEFCFWLRAAASCNSSQKEENGRNFIPVLREQFNQLFQSHFLLWHFILLICPFNLMTWISNGIPPLIWSVGRKSKYRSNKVSFVVLWIEMTIALQNRVLKKWQLVRPSTSKKR